MIRINRLFIALFCTILSIPGLCSGETDQQYIDATVRDIFMHTPLSYAPLHGGALAQVQLVTTEPKSVVVRKINEDNTFESCVKECVVGRMCAELAIGPALYAADPARKVLFLEYLDAKAVPRDKFGTESFLHELGNLVARFHVLDPMQLEEEALKHYNHALKLPKLDLFALYNMDGQIERTSTMLEQVGLTTVQVKEWYIYFKQKLDQLDDLHGSKIVLGHGDLHWGNCLYADDSIWLIDYESVGIAPWWYDLGVLGAHFSFFDDQDEFLLEGYFGIRRELIDPFLKEQYRYMKYSAMLYYALYRLNKTEIATIQQALDTHMDLDALHTAYKNNTFSLSSEYAHAQLAIAMIHAVGDVYTKLKVV